MAFLRIVTLVFGVLLYIQGLRAAHVAVGGGPIHAADWSYGDGPTGPTFWPTLFPEQCNNSRQSPINLDPWNASPSNAQPLQLNGYRNNDIPNPSTMVAVNNGHSVQVSLTGDFNIKGGPLAHTYQAAQFHFHWGSTDSQGSEHSISHKHYSAEMHIVHWNRDLYDDIDQAVASNDRTALAVLGIFIEVGDHNVAFQNLVDVIKDLQYNGGSVGLDVFAIGGLLPDKLNKYYHYDGSLTTPTCNEVIQWIVYDEPIEVAPLQLAPFRKIYHNAQGEKDELLDDNFRPTQPLNERTLYLAGGP